MLPDVTRRICPPRALSVPFPLGYPLGQPNVPELQRHVLEALLALCGSLDVPRIASWEV